MLRHLRKIFKIYLCCQFYWKMKLEYFVKTTDLTHVTEKLHHVMLH